MNLSESDSGGVGNNQPSTSRDTEDQAQDDDAEPETYTATGTMIKSTPGADYQFKHVVFALACVLQPGYSSLQLATEIKEAGKFDDLFLRYKNGSGEQVGRFVQIKHKSDQNAKISEKELLAANGDFSLPRYFTSWREAVNKSQFGDLNSRNFILSTNADIELTDLRTQKVSCNDETTEYDKSFELKSSEKQSAWYKFEANRETNQKLYDELKKTSDRIVLAQQLAQRVWFGKLREEQGSLFQKYHVALAIHVFDHKTKTFHDKFIQKPDRETDRSLEKFRDTFLSEYKRLLKLPKSDDSGEAIWIDLKQRLGSMKNVQQDFGESFKVVQNPQLTEIEELSDRFVELLKNAADGHTVKILTKKPRPEEAEQPIQVIIDNLDKLSGHVLIEDNEKKIRFRLQFLRDQHSSGNIGQFRDALKKKLPDNYKLNGFRFNLQDYKVFREEQLLTEGKLPDDDVKDEDIERFLKEFRFEVNQPNSEEISEAIARKLIATGRFDVPPTKLLSDAFENKVHDHFKKSRTDKTKLEYISDKVGKDILDWLKHEVRSVKSTGAYTKYFERLKEFDVRFKSEMPLVAEFLAANITNPASDRILQLVAAEKTLLTTLRVRGTLEHEKYEERGRFIFIQLDHFELEFVTTTVIPAFESQERLDLLVIDCRLDKIENYSAVLWNLLYKIVKPETSSKKIILITQTDTCLRNSFITRYKKHIEEDSNYSFHNLAHETQTKLLKKPVIKFQGHETSFWKLLGISDAGSLEEIELKNPSQIIDSSTLLDLICGNELQICNNLKSLIEKDCYMTRTIRHVIIEETILRGAEESELFAISGAHGRNSQPPEDPPKITYLNNRKEQKHFSRLCKQYSEKNIHWLRKNSKKLKEAEYIWEKSHGNITQLAQNRKFRNIGEAPSTSPTIPEGLLAASNKPVIISDAAGMGKSMMLTHLASELKKKHPDMLVVKINLSQHITDFEEVQNQSDLFSGDDQAVKFLVNKLLSSVTGLGRKIARRIIEEKGKVALMFDGFDEIMDRDNEEKVLKLLGALVIKHGIRNLFVATRPETRKALEDGLQTLSYEVQPFSRENQEEFLVKFWEFNLNPDSDKKITKRIQMYTKRILTKVAESIDDRINEFVGIPLHTKLVAEIFQTESASLEMNYDSCEEFVRDTIVTPLLPDKINLIYLYEHFVEKKFDIFLAPVGEANPKHPRVIAVRGREHNRYINIHEEMALYALLDKEQVKELLHHRRYGNRSLRGQADRDIADERSGLITRFDDHGRPEFGHKTYAEYFAASFLKDTLKSGEVNLPVRKIIQKVLFYDKYQTMRAFINCFLEGESGDGYDGECWEFGGFRRRGNPTEFVTIFHKAVLEGNEHILRYFLNYLDTNPDHRRAVLNAKDDLEFTALHRAAEALFRVRLRVDKGDTAADRGALKYVKFLVDAGADVNAKGLGDFTPLQIAVWSDDNSNVVTYLLQNGADIESKDYMGATALHRAALTRCSNITEILLKAGAIVDSKDRNGDTPLHIHLGSRHGWDTKCNLNKKAKINFDAKDIDNDIAAGHNSLEIVKILLTHGANINSENNYLNRPIHYAVLNHKLNVVQYLVENGAIVNCANKYRITPLHAAAAFGKLDVVKYLVKKEANIYSKKNSGKTPRDIAASRRKWHVEDYLREVEDNDNSENKNRG